MFICLQGPSSAVYFVYVLANRVSLNMMDPNHVLVHFLSTQLWALVSFLQYSFVWSAGAGQYGGVLLCWNCPVSKPTCCSKHILFILIQLHVKLQKSIGNWSKFRQLKRLMRQQRQLQLLQERRKKYVIQNEALEANNIKLESLLIFYYIQFLLCGLNFLYMEWNAFIIRPQKIFLKANIVLRDHILHIKLKSWD